MPDDAAIVLDIKLLEDLEEMAKTPIWHTFQSAGILNNLEKKLFFLDSISGEGGFSSTFQNVPVLISAHKVSNTTIDYLYVVDLQNILQSTFIRSSIARLKQSGYRLKTRNYNGFNIGEMSNGKRPFTFVFHKNFFLASFTPYLVEDGIRTINDHDIFAFRETYKEVPPGNIHINYAQLGNLIESFIVSKVQIPLASGSYHIEIDSLFIHLSGLTAPKEWLRSHASLPGNFEMVEVVPSHAAVFYHFSSSDLWNWKSKQVHFLENNPSIKRLNDSLSKVIDYHPGQVFDLIDDEMGLVQLESSTASDDQKLFILKVKDAGEAAAYFRQVTERVAYARGDSAYSESYSERDIRFFPVKAFPKTILGKIAKGFDQCFYINYRNYLIFSNDIQELKSLVSLMDSEETWGKSLHINEFLNHTNAHANVGVFVNIPRAWHLFSQQTKLGWKGYFQSHKNAFGKVELMAFQISWINDQYYTNITFSQPTEFIANSSENKAHRVATFETPLTSKPFLVKTHFHSNFDYMVQDSDNTIYYLDRNFSTIWTRQLKEPIIGKVHKIDYYRNGKLQYAFASTSYVHIIDRKGVYIPGYPKQLPGASKIRHFGIIDYSKNRNYRIAITDEDGNIYLTNKALETLQGWDPLPYHQSAIEPLRHARMGRKDVMISIQTDGIINVSNRKGEKMPGFPFNAQMNPDHHIYLNPSYSLDNSSLTILSTKGQLLEINFKGVIIKKNQLAKDSPSAVFQLIPDHNEKSFIIIRKKGNTYHVLDAKGNPLFVKDYLSYQNVLIQYYQFGAGKDLIVFTDVVNQALYIYDQLGNMVTEAPLRSAHHVAITYSPSKKELRVYTTAGHNVACYSLYY